VECGRSRIRLSEIVSPTFQIVPAFYEWGHRAEPIGFFCLALALFFVGLVAAYGPVHVMDDEWGLCTARPLAPNLDRYLAGPVSRIGRSIPFLRDNP
jgi:hypothetical protein